MTADEHEPNTEGSRSGRRGFDADDAFRMMNEIQRMGFDAASAVVDRFTKLVGSTIADEPRPAARGLRFTAEETPDLLEGAGRLVDAYLDMVQSSWSALSRVVERATSGQPLVGRAGHVVFPAGSAGTTSSTRVWLHNTSREATGMISLVASDLIAQDASRIEHAAVRFRPDRLESLAPGASTAIEIIIEIPAGAVPGEYHGVLLTSYQPDGRTTFSVGVEAPGR